eukprot:TRINITY_DN91262_c0_g1_i2.p2 TRINITY_DN91262_c0_g1~~TRINITY_DN91262_c0_g1_i2.p2  ORF type:complete len:264 (-),score=37.74 TRINITY_DN91262_c0_g1_i2:121-912(-)
MACFAQRIFGQLNHNPKRVFANRSSRNLLGTTRAQQQVNYVQNRPDNSVKDKSPIMIAGSVGVGIGSSFLVGQQAEAAQQLADFAATDNRLGLLFLLALPALGWVLFNIAGPALNQLGDMQDRKKVVPVALGLGLGSSLFAYQQAEAAQVIANLAADDKRFGLILLLGLPVIGWVAFNIAGPALNQLSDMSEKKKAIPIGIGMGVGASLFATQQAEAAQQIVDLADNRLNLLFLLALPALGWVAFNILGPALSQLDNMSQKQR